MARANHKLRNTVIAVSAAAATGIGGLLLGNALRGKTVVTDYNITAGQVSTGNGDNNDYPVVPRCDGEHRHEYQGTVQPRHQRPHCKRTVKEPSANGYDSPY